MSIPPEASTFHVLQFEDISGGPATLSQIFSERLRDKVRGESRLKYVDTDPDISFSGIIQSFNVSYVAPQDELGSAFNRLTITVRVKYESEYDPGRKLGEELLILQ